MRLDIASLSMAILWNIIFISVVFVMEKKKAYTSRKGIQIILIFYLLGVIRMLFPVDFQPSIGIPISKGVFLVVNNVLGLEEHSFLGVDFTIANGIVIFWSAIAIILMLRYFTEYRQMHRLFQKCSVIDEMCEPVIEQIKLKKKIKKKISVYRNSAIAIPCAEGIFRLNIYLPKCEYSEEELYYILLHECTHFANGDLYIKWLTQICRCLCWWNPLVYKMQDMLEKNLEIRCDLTVTENLEQIEQITYLETIVKALKNIEKKNNSGILYGVQLTNRNGKELKERFEIIYKNRKNKTKKSQKMKCLAMFLIMMIFSYVIMITPAYYPAEEEIITGEGIEEMTTKNTYILKEGEKYYTIHKSEIRGKIEKEELSSEEVKEMQENGFEVKENEEK